MKDIADNIYDISYKGYYVFKNFFNEVGIFKKTEIFGFEKYNYIYNKIRQCTGCLSGIKSGVL